MNLSWDQLQNLCRIAQDAGAEVMQVYSVGGSTWVKEDQSPLTEADLRSDAVIRERLEAAFPSMFILSEESSSPAGQSADPFFLVDPLDGTREFLKRNGEFTVNIALVSQGEAVAGVVYAPALGEMFYAARGLGAWKSLGGDARRLNTSAVDGTRALRIIGSRSHGVEDLERWTARLSCAHELVAAGSSLKFCRIAEGHADVYPRIGPTCQWDTAAGHAVLQQAGGVVLDPQGRPLAYGTGRPMLNSHFIAIGDRSLELPSIA